MVRQMASEISPTEMRIGNANVDIMEYRLRENQLSMEQSKEEKDIGVAIDDKLSFDQHINENKANSILGVIRRSFECLDLCKNIKTVIYQPCKTTSRIC